MNQGIDPLTVLDYFLGWFVEVMTHPAMVYVLGALKVVITLLILLLAAFYAAREFMTHLALSPFRRRRYLLRATGKPDWSMEDLERWAAQISMVRRRVRRRMDRPAHAIRIRLESTPHGPKYTMESSWRFERVMLNPALPGVKVTRLRPRSWSMFAPGERGRDVTPPQPPRQDGTPTGPRA
jgi:hypothetical protein